MGGLRRPNKRTKKSWRRSPTMPAVAPAGRDSRAARAARRGLDLIRRAIEHQGQEGRLPQRLQRGPALARARPGRSQSSPRSWASARTTPTRGPTLEWPRRRWARKRRHWKACKGDLHFDPRAAYRDARKRLATLLRGIARHEEAVQLFEQALADHPTAETYADFGSLLLALGRTVEAAIAYRKAIGLKPDYATARLKQPRAGT